MSTNSSPIARPQSTPSTAYLELNDKPLALDKCHVCLQVIFSQAFAEISQLFSDSKKSICSHECFQKYIHANKQSRKIKPEAPKTTNLTLSQIKIDIQKPN